MQDETSFCVCYLIHLLSLCLTCDGVMLPAQNHK
ncbi:hypothetical protein GLYMA_09G169050v4 [Glycine max]|nr:hypothetical protein GLYMA_09G169050v4 [Glycine max]KAH1043401.1 hypothetical protein GYH30_025300 [Glycine max]